MNDKVKNIRPDKPKKLRKCPIFERQKEDLNKLIAELVDAPDTWSKTKWSWGIVQGAKPLLECSRYRKRAIPCQQCRQYTEPRKKLADLVILGAKM